MLEELKKQVCEANLRLLAEGLVVQTFGNASGIDRQSGNVVIKPSGISYDQMKPKHMVVVSLETAGVVEGELRPSSDAPTHLELYRAFQGIGGVAHTHSLYATAWAQSRREIAPQGTTHADYFYGPVPVTRTLTAEEISGDYELNTGKVIAERFASLDPLRMQAVLVAGHGPFVWGASPDEAAENAVNLEYVARLASETIRIEPYPKPISQELLDRHFFRKHGPGAYYGQE
ncbi:MAG: L-ribulose-5-phosphate 4-epimerase AraD [Planctomycetota bacterium]|jgi:L-ribulose-5-phosphate 4-epimerase